MPNGRPYTPDELAEIRVLARAGATAREVATALGRSYESVRCRMRPKAHTCSHAAIRRASRRFALDGAAVFGRVG